MRLLKEDFCDILEKQRIKPLFQPIVSLKDGEIIGYEALSRIVESKKINSTEELFKLAGLYGKTWELEQLCRNKILEKYGELCKKNKTKKLFLNVNPMVIHDETFKTGFTYQYLEKYSLAPENLIFEVTERSAVEDMRSFRETIRHYKLQGYKIAIDDAGSCYSGLNLICDIIPHYLKLDIGLIKDIHQDTIKYAMVKSMVEFANLTNIELIAEGIENKEDLRTLIKLGVHNGQGYFLRVPNEEFKSIQPEALEIIRKVQRKKSVRNKIQNGIDKEYRVILFKIGSYKALRAYRQKYGDEQGDEILKMMKCVVDENLSEIETMAMVDEETIVSVLEKENSRIKCEIIANKFRSRLKSYYNDKDWKAGYIECMNKHDEIRKCPLLDICVERLV